MTRPADGIIEEGLPSVRHPLAYADCLRRYDGPDSLFYLDPPYWGYEQDYGPGVFRREDFQKLAVSWRFPLFTRLAPATAKSNMPRSFLLPIMSCGVR